MAKTNLAALGLLFLFVIVLQEAASISPLSRKDELDDKEFEEKFEKEWESYTDKSKYKDPERIKKFFWYYAKNALPGQNDTFNMRDTHTRDTTVSLIDAIIGMGDKESVGYTLLGLSWRNNSEQATFATLTMGYYMDQLDKQELRGHPPYSSLFPRFFISTETLERMASSIANGTFSANDTSLLVTPSSSEGAAYFREDAGLSSAYTALDVMLSRWIDPKRYDSVTDWSKRSEVIYEYLNFLVSAYNLREDNEWEFEWNDEIKMGHTTELTNPAGKHMSSRKPNHPHVENQYYRKLMDIYNKVEKISADNAIYINESYSLPLNEQGDQMVSILTSLVYNTTDSVNPSYYGSYFDAAVDYIASLDSDQEKDAGGVVNYTMSAPRDPAFYGILNNVNKVIKKFKVQHSHPYTKEELLLEDVVLSAMGLTRLETYFEIFEMQTGSYVGGFLNWPGASLKALRLNLVPFEMKFDIKNKGKTVKNALLTVVLLKDTRSGSMADGYQPLDRFPVQLNPGVNTIVRDIRNSSVFVNDTKDTLNCGIPLRLALPKGTEEGKKVTFAAFVTPYDDGEEHANDKKEWGKESVLCGIKGGNYGKPLGFPLDRTDDNLDYLKGALFVLDTQVYHRKNEFSEAIVM